MAHPTGAVESLLPLDGYRVAVTADRRAAELAELLKRTGAEVLIAPVIRTLPLADEDTLRRLTEDVIREPSDLVLLTTGIGLRSWFAAAEAWGLDELLRESLAAARIVARGPKAAAAVNQAGLTVWRQEPTEQLHHMITGLEHDGALAGARVVLQLPGEPLPEAIAMLEEAGATVVAVPVYEWRYPVDASPARRLAAGVIESRLDAVTFTSPPAVRNFVSLADQAGLGGPLRSAFDDGVVAACVGPVTGATARAEGLGEPVWPERGRLGLLVRVLCERLAASHQRWQVEGAEVVVQGSVLLCSEHRVALTARELAVLLALTRRPGAVVSKSVLLREAWGSVAADPHVLEVTVARLRRRLEPAGLAVLISPRRGYRLARSA